MRTINKIIIHCADTPPEMDIGADEINDWHLARGWSGIGYHYVIRRNGTVEIGRSLEKQGAHVFGHNEDSIGICLVGGKGGRRDDVFSDNFVFEQSVALDDLLTSLIKQFPDATVRGHQEFSSKACPCFNAQTWWIEGIDLEGQPNKIDTMILIVDAIDDQLSDMRQMLLDMQKAEKE